MTDAREYASVDLGSNSFHLVLARMVDDELFIVDKLKERVRLAGVDGKESSDPGCSSESVGMFEAIRHRLSICPRNKSGWWGPIRCERLAALTDFGKSRKRTWA